MPNKITNDLDQVREKAQKAFDLCAKGHGQLYHLLRHIQTSIGVENLSDDGDQLVRDINKGMDAFSAVRDQLAYDVIQPIERFFKKGADEKRERRTKRKRD